MFFYPWYPPLMLAVECNNVIDIRARKMANGGVNALEEARPMVREKVDAALEAGAILMSGRKSADVIDFSRKSVAANMARLT